jgi:hypothetical protein
MRVDLKGLHRVVSKGHVYYYAKRGGPRVETTAEPGTAEFMQAYNEASNSSTAAGSCHIHGGTANDHVARNLPQTNLP